MNTSRKNNAAYTQAIISILLLLCTFLPYKSVNNGEYSISLAVCFATLEGIDFKSKIIGFLYTIYFMFHVVNIIVQMHGSNRIFSAILSFIGFIGLAILHLFLPDYFDYSIAFYLIIFLMIAQVAIPALILMPENMPATTNPEVMHQGMPVDSQLQPNNENYTENFDANAAEQKTAEDNTEM